MMNNLHWEKEEFEDLVARGLIAMYETKIKKRAGSHKVFHLTDKLLEKIRKIGCYFTPEDRVSLHNFVPGTSVFSENQPIDLINDGLPRNGILCSSIEGDKEGEDSMRKDAFLEISYIEQVDKLPKPMQSDHWGKFYKLVQVWARNNLLEGHVNYFSVDKNGNTNGTYWYRSFYDSIRGICKGEKVNSRFCQSKEESNKAQDLMTLTGSMTIQYWQDRRFLWNVTANEGIAKATFGVYPEQIKSLFYAREIPLTETGRKRPILHWVSAHQRRIKSGIEIDIDKHLRGTTEFVYQGTKFIITSPIKSKDL